MSQEDVEIYTVYLPDTKAQEIFNEQKHEDLTQ